MGDPAERYRATFALVIDCVIHMAPARPPSQAGGNRKADQRSCAGNDRDRRPRQTGQRAAGKQGGEPQHPVADDAAEADRQRPGRSARERGGTSGGQQDGEDAEREPNALALQRPMGGESPAPNGDRQDQRERRHAKKLDQKIGDNGPRYPEHVAYRCIGGMAERRVVHRPGREREREQGRDQEQRESPSSRSLRRNASRNASGRKVKRSRPRSIAGMLPLSPAPRRGDAAPVPWFLGPAPWRRECSRGPDWSHRPGHAPDSGPV